MKSLTSIRGRLGPLCALLGIFLAGRSLAFHHSNKPELPNFDKRDLTMAATETRGKTSGAGVEHLRALIPDANVDWDDLLAAPRWVRSEHGFLSGPGSQGGGISSATAAKFGAGEDHRAVKAFLREHSALFGYDESILQSALVERDYVTPHNGLRTVVWHQQLNGVPVFDALLTAHTTKNGELVSLASGFVAEAQRAAKGGSPAGRPLELLPAISAEQAVFNATTNLGESVSLEQISQAPARSAEAKGVRRVRAAPVLNGETETRLVWLPIDPSSMRLCWEVILTSRARGEMFRVVVDAQDGQVWIRHCLTAYLSDATYRVFTGDSPTPFSPGWSTPNTAQPTQVQRSLVTLSALNTTASPNGWINDGDNETRGNNVDAHTDLNGDDLPDTPRPQGSPSRVFDFALDLTQAPSAYRNASVVQLFYWCNFMHDKLYELGFTEGAGNYQNDNFGRGGLGNDAVQADAQDGSGVRNANFTPAPDGTPGRIQMFLFPGPSPNRDGDLDGEIICHEYTHGLSTRLVGGGIGISAVQAMGMGEGWSDFYALSFLSQSSDALGGNYPAGAYVALRVDNAKTFQENYYFGIRRYPYSTDMSKNPLTFRDIDTAQISPHTGIPRSSVDWLVGQPANEVHNQGEVWCVTLWEARANLICRHGWAVGNQLMLQLVTDGMRLGPANPTFLQARDAILLADRVNNGDANVVELWLAFARRGMGAGATSPASSTTAGVHEDFGVPPHLMVWVDFNFPCTLCGQGTFDDPYNSILRGVLNVPTGRTIVMKAGTSSETITIRNSCVLEAFGGPATIGR